MGPDRGQRLCVCPGSVLASEGAGPAQGQFSQSAGSSDGQLSERASAQDQPFLLLLGRQYEASLPTQLSWVCVPFSEGEGRAGSSSFRWFLAIYS